MLKTVPELVTEARAGLRCVDIETAKAELKENNGTVIDVRELVEVSHLEATGSLNIPRGILEMKIGEAVPDENRTLYLHCATGGRATFAAQQLVKMGYRNVTVITCPIETICTVMAD
ncbi:rhodanese-like domain-containing protein [Halioglobus maricola]|uniref:Rhodanese-like domain-containing protein n=1 Tax=Halioglobus maricola TaxID=2601894 RepID=A0A5P9NN14_9GAMM|nr:rhodanese-like domain-containing protein [Halioglobus maricola]QFU77263.1 rhodanese-like domain-containing protein [Halioglobus maricola]